MYLDVEVYQCVFDIYQDTVVTSPVCQVPCVVSIYIDLKDDRFPWWLQLLHRMILPLLHLGKIPPNSPTFLCFPLIPSCLWVHKLDQIIFLLYSLICYSICTWKSYRQHQVPPHKVSINIETNNLPPP